MQQATAGRPFAPAVVLSALAFLAAAPALAVVLSLAAGPDGARLGEHVWASAGPRYLSGTLLLCLLTGLGAGLMGAAAAAILTLTDLPGRRFWTIALAAPFAAPAYIVAYVYGDLFSPFGPGTALFQMIGLPAPPVRSLAGAACVLALTTYPYVFLALRASLAQRSGAMIEAARALGVGPMRAMATVLAPLSRPALAGGISLVLMETAADFGVADYFGVPTLSTGIFRTWQGLGSLTAASQIAVGLFAVALLLMALEEIGRRGAVSEAPRAGRATAPIPLGIGGRILATLVLAAPVLAGFVLPVAHLTALALDAGPAVSDRLRPALNTLGVAAVGAGVALIAALAIAYCRRRLQGPFARLTARLATAGYALPGALVAIGVLQGLSLLPGASGSLAWSAPVLLVYAYVVRFLTAGYQGVSAGLDQIHRGLDDAAWSLGLSPADILRRVHAPLAAPAVLAAFLIVLIDIMKELPATLILRPFNFETLATKVYRLASDERLADAAPEALLLIAVGLVPTLLLTANRRRRFAASASP